MHFIMSKLFLYIEDIIYIIDFSMIFLILYNISLLYLCFFFILHYFLVYFLLSPNDEADYNHDVGNDTKTPPGLVNFGNICFVNSSLQVLIA